MKLEKSQVQWIVKEKKKGELTNAQIAGTMDVTVRWVQKLWARHKGCPAASEISHPAPMGRPQNGLPGRREHSAVMSARHAEHMGAAGLQQRIADGEDPKKEGTICNAHFLNKEVELQI